MNTNTLVQPVRITGDISTRFESFELLDNQHASALGTAIWTLLGSLDATDELAAGCVRNRHESGMHQAFSLRAYA